MSNSIIFFSFKFKSGVLFIFVSFILLFSFLILCDVKSLGQGNLLIAPHRVVFEGKTRIIDINLVNAGQDSPNYNISFLQYRMTEDGVFQKITAPDPGQRFSDKNIRFFPRSIMLGPNETQTIKIQVIKSEQLEPGEYRSHLYFRSLPKQMALGEETVKKDSSISIRIVPIFGTSIPVIIRIGESTTSLTLTNLKLGQDKDGKINKLLLNIQRDGNMSVIGDISITYIAPNGKETKLEGEPGVVKYTPNTLRRMVLGLENETTVDLTKDKIHVTYSSQSEVHPVKLAEADLIL